MPDVVFRLPLPIAGCLIIGTICLYALAGTALTRRFLLPRLQVRAQDSEFSGAMLQATMVFYGLAMALIAVSVWETHAEVEDTVSQEAGRLAALYRDVSGYPEPLRSELQGELSGYVGYLIEEAWPQQRQGIHPTRGVEWMNRFQASLTSFEPSTEGMKILHAEALRAYNHMLESRRKRMDAMLVKLPGTLWFVVHVGAAISIATTFFFRVRDPRLHYIQVTLLSVFIGLIIALIVAFDRPFHGVLGVGPEPYQSVREQLMAPTPAAHPQR